MYAAQMQQRRGDSSQGRGGPAGNYPRLHDAAGTADLLAQQHRHADAPGFSHAAFTSWKKHGLPTAQSGQTMPFGRPTKREESAGAAFSGSSFPEQQQRAPQRSRAVNPVTWENAPADDVPRRQWDSMRREEAPAPAQPVAGATPCQSQWQMPPPSPRQPSQVLHEKEKENPGQTWGQLMRSRPVRPSAALCMIDTLTDAEHQPNARDQLPRVPADNFSYIGMRLPGQQNQSHARSQKFSSSFSDPFM